MRVLHVDTARELRGGQRQLAYLLAGRPGDAWAGVADSPLAAEIGPPALALLPGGDPRNLPALRRFARDFDLVAAHTPHAHGLALFAGRPLVVHRRVDFVPRHAWKYRPVAATIAVSHAVRRILEATGVRRVHVVHDGVAPVALGTRIPAVGPVYGAAGALVEHKGHRHLVEAMREVPGTLLLAGEGPLRPALEAQIRAAGLGDRVRLLGHVPIGDLFASVDVFVHPSVEEGLGQVVIEALGAGLRVVATRAGGLPESVEGVGTLVPPGDAEALARALREAPQAPTGLGVARAADFSVARMVEGTTAVYATVAEGTSAA